MVARNVFSLSLPVSLVARVELCELLGINGKAHAEGVEAGYIIFNPWAWFHWAWDRSLWLLLGLLPLTLALATIPALLLLGLSASSVIDVPPQLLDDRMDWAAHHSHHRGRADRVGLALVQKERSSAVSSSITTSSVTSETLMR